ncbi:hypothetical protein INS49_014681 [Diaporthe citri]|uniref:uncharacterized protein n=1 Tax=Diaporthe citri TaxID=83186 RepID=UPI001C80AC30|nr:uncharacterized protein INS49_014681 [Diaporthe citri]KAG6356807.1 hypothetical protein INS49_014681 [Diaporthe citri]
MSGLEGIAALGLACNILQLIGTVADSITVAKNMLKSGTIDPALERRNDELTKLFQDVKGSLSEVPEREDDRELRDVAGHILKTAAELKIELAKISGGSSQGWARKVIGGIIKAIFRQKKLERLEEKVLAYQRAFESRLLLSLRSRIDLSALQRKDDFNRLDNSLQGFIKGLSNGHTKLEDLLRDQSSTLHEISTTMQAVVRNMDSREKQGFLYSLRYDTMNERFNRIELAHSGTFEWIFRQDPESDEDTDIGSGRGVREDSAGRQGSGYCPDFDIPSFVQSDTDNIYWITGKPGSGKSTLMKFMIDDPRMQSLLKQVFPACMSIIASHFIWAAGTSVQKSLRGILSSLLFQILSQDKVALDSLASQFLNKPQRLSLNDWSEHQLNEALQMVCSDSRNAVCVLIDGLDEIEPRDIQKILNVIDDLSTLPYTKCIVSSRPEEIFSRHFTRRGARYLSMQNFTGSDVRRYATEEVNQWIDDSERLRDVVNILCRRAEGVFLWVALAVKGQRLGAVYKDGPELLARRLEQLPMGLSELYSDMWNRLNEDKDIYGEQGAKYLNQMMEMTPFGDHLCMAFATQPALVRKSFQPSSLAFLDELEDILEDLVVWIRVRTAGLIETETGGYPREIEFVHRSAVEFLENTAKGLEITSLDKTTLAERRFLGTITDFCTYQDIALQTEVCGTILQDASSDYHALFKIPWYNQVGERAHSLVRTTYNDHDHIFEHREEFNIYVEMPITLLVKFHNDRISSEALSVESYEDLLLHQHPATTKETPMALVIQSWVDMSYQLKAFSTAPEQYFLLEDEEDKHLVMVVMVRGEIF